MDTITVGYHFYLSPLSSARRSRLFKHAEFRITMNCDDKDIKVRIGKNFSAAKPEVPKHHKNKFIINTVTNFFFQKKTKG